MKKAMTLILSAVVILCLAACSGASEDELEALRAERDALQAELESVSAELEAMHSIPWAELEGELINFGVRELGRFTDENNKLTIVVEITNEFYYTQNPEGFTFALDISAQLLSGADREAGRAEASVKCLAPGQTVVMAFEFENPDYFQTVRYTPRVSPSEVENARGSLDITSNGRTANVINSGDTPIDYCAVTVVYYDDGVLTGVQRDVLADGAGKKLETKIGKYVPISGFHDKHKMYFEAWRAVS